MFLLFKTQKRHHTVSENIQSNVLFKVLITNPGPCGYINAFSEKHLRYSLFVKRIIAIEEQLYHGFFGDLGDTHLLVCQWSGWREISVELAILFPYFTFFLSLVFKILPFTYLYSPRLHESGGHRKSMAKEVHVSKHTDYILISILSLQTPALAFTLGPSCWLSFYIIYM